MKQDINIKNLIVNPDNYRFDPVDNQQEAIDLMLKEKGNEIFNLASHILENGLDKAKDSRVLKIKKDKFLVLDGNRRTTAIKCLHNPSLVRESALKIKFQKLLKNNKNHIIEEVNCFIYENEEDAAQWIKLDHTGKNSGIGQESWGSASVDRFSYKFEGKISPAMQLVNLLEDKTNTKIDTKKLKITTINRIISNPEAREYIGVSVKNKQVSIEAKEDVSISRIEKLFNKIIKDDVKVSEVYDKEKSIDFLKKLFKTKLNKNSTKNTSPVDKKPTSKAKQSPNNGTLLEKDWITENLYRGYTKQNRVKRILKEMKYIKPDNYENVSGVSLRVLLELALYSFLEDNGHIKKIIDNEKNRIKEENIKRIKNSKAIIEMKKNWSPSFKDMLKYMAEEKSNIVSDPQKRKAIEKLAKNKDYKEFVDDMNSFIHNLHYNPDSKDVKNIWKKFGKIIFDIVS